MRKEGRRKGAKKDLEGCICLAVSEEITALDRTVADIGTEVEVEEAEGMFVVGVCRTVNDMELEGRRKEMAVESVEVETEGSGEVIVPADRVVAERMEEGGATRVLELADDGKVA